LRHELFTSNPIAPAIEPEDINAHRYVEVVAESTRKAWPHASCAQNHHEIYRTRAASDRHLRRAKLNCYSNKGRTLGLATRASERLAFRRTRRAHTLGFNHPDTGSGASTRRMSVIERTPIAWRVSSMIHRRWTCVAHMRSTTLASGLSMRVAK